jgi:hypothetical protein
MFGSAHCCILQHRPFRNRRPFRKPLLHFAAGHAAVHFRIAHYRKLFFDGWPATKKQMRSSRAAGCVPAAISGGYIRARDERDVSQDERDARWGASRESQQLAPRRRFAATLASEVLLPA